MKTIQTKDMNQNTGSIHTALRRINDKVSGVIFKKRNHRTLTKKLTKKQAAHHKSLSPTSKEKKNKVYYNEVTGTIKG